MKLPKTQSFFSADLSTEEIAAILRRIEENITQRAPVEGYTYHSNLATELLPDWQELVGHLQALREQQAPFFVVHGRKPADLLRLALNIPIRIFGYKQARFNIQLLNLLEKVLLSTQAMRLKIAKQEAEMEALRSELRLLITVLKQDVYPTDTST